eukprot:TRINITY_DN6206_c0_g1_i1.p1 TRINITY_DN6206_c0_g1~~TRINITY_DN6206_c0_g1_i1.p1  ORF type:complete len:155 (+),score=39.51 TRINITY_DN6206_c0_g1_i1:45-467(+)
MEKAKDAPKKLSTKVLDMKFMHRSKEDELRKQLLEEQKRTVLDSHWVSDKFQEEESLPQVIVSETRPDAIEFKGRQSFRKFNPSLEVKVVAPVVPEVVTNSLQEDVSSTEMLQRLSKNKKRGREYDPMDRPIHKKRKISH